jgi:hypothetical protein
MSDNMQLWNRFEKTDPKYTKNFKGTGGFEGTDINPMWRAKKMTEAFGPCGIGWGSEEIDVRIETGLDGTKVWYSKVRVWYIWEGQRGTIEQWGGTRLSGTNKNGCFTDDEAAKKSYTDAEGKCFTKIGIGADIYLKLFDGSKYSNPPAEEAAPAVKEKSPFELAKGIIPKMPDFADAKKKGALIQTRYKEKAIDLAQATQLCIMWEGHALGLCREIADAYEVLAVVEQFKEQGLISDGTYGDFSKSCMNRVKELS